MDPTVVYGCECRVCGNWQTDNETDVDDRCVCWDCVDAEESDDAPEPDGFWSVACDIITARYPS